MKSGWKYALIANANGDVEFPIAFPPSVPFEVIENIFRGLVMSKGYLRMATEHDGTFWRWECYGPNSSPDDRDFFNQP